MRCESKTFLFIFFFSEEADILFFFIKDCREKSAGIVPNDCCSIKSKAESC